MKHDTIEVDRIRALRSYHMEQAKRCDDALLLFADVRKMEKRADALTGKVRKRAKGHGISDSARQLQRKLTGTRPTDRLRTLFTEHKGSKPLTKQQLLDKSGFLQQASPHGNLTQEGAAQRTLGLALMQMKKSNEIRETKDGFVVKKLQPFVNAAAAAANGTGAQPHA